MKTIVLFCAALLLVVSSAHAKLRVGAATNDLASIAASVGGAEIEVFSLASAGADPHRVEALPSSMMKVARAQLFLRVGLGLDQWADAIVDGSRNAKLVVIDCSTGVNVLEKPTGKVDASMGDVHPYGNPHYWLDPRNGVIVAHTIAEAFAKADAAHAADYRARAVAFGKDAEAALARGRAKAALLPSKHIFTYHRSWPYLADAFGLEIVNTIEPVPGIPPTARHLAELVKVAKAENVKLLLQEPYFSVDAGKFLARQSGVRAVTASPSCEAPVAGSYLQHMDNVLGALAGEAK